ncbi:putative MPP superfamily phosphohydrolase [Methanolinea mesophila]|uniref:metallophosphoesterase n=1 Tax=Methanolinea mesophila TaxID=547055 RepID=UPI001AE5DFD1|nr:metallophosphoesterase [Methanolinea mesophila]MBP1929621.1 putative MPP superfamily phosphohydrolase [Methanolinea mesophila]
MQKDLPRPYQRHYLAVILLFSLVSTTGLMFWDSGTMEISTLTVNGTPGRIVFLADPHIRPNNLDQARGVVERINALHPSLVLIGGDFVYRSGDDLSLQEVWSEIDAPVYAVLGNHDYNAGIKGSGVEGKVACAMEEVLRLHDYNTSEFYSDTCDDAYADALEAVLEKNGVTVLRNEWVTVPAGGGNVTLVGVDDIWAGNAAVPGDVPGDFTIYMVHEPVETRYPDADLILSGHTHGGQFDILPLQLLNSVGLIRTGGLYWNGDIPVFITRGLGTSNFEHEYRLGATPEIVVIDPGTGVSGPAGIPATARDFLTGLVSIRAL